MSSSRSCVSQKGQLCEGRHRPGSWMGCSCPHLSYKNVPKGDEETQSKKRLWLKNARSTRCKAVTENPRKIEMKVSRITLR